jgi:ketosteroid isomerase-like protein
MSEAHREVVKRGLDAFNSGDVEMLLPDLDPDIEFIPRRAPVQGAYRGHEGVREFFADNAENLDEFRVHLDEVIDLGSRVVGVGTVSIRGKGSGVEVTAPTATVITFREGKIVRFEECGEREQALAVARAES